MYWYKIKTIDKNNKSFQNYLFNVVHLMRLSRTLLRNANMEKTKMYCACMNQMFAQHKIYIHPLIWWMWRQKQAVKLYLYSSHELFQNVLKSSNEEPYSTTCIMGWNHLMMPLCQNFIWFVTLYYLWQKCIFLLFIYIVFEALHCMGICTWATATHCAVTL